MLKSLKEERKGMGEDDGEKRQRGKREATRKRGGTNGEGRREIEQGILQ